MKFLVVCLTLGLIINVQALTEDQKLKLKEHFKVCQASTGADLQDLDKLQKGDFSIQNMKVKEWLFCVFKKSQIMSDGGKFFKDIALMKIEEDNRDKVAKAIDACVHTIGSNGLESAWNFAKCYKKERPEHNFSLV